MKNFALRLELGALCVAFVLLVADTRLNAQNAGESPPAKSSPAVDELAQAELLKSYLQVRDQLHATQLAIASSRAETEANARAQAAAVLRFSTAAEPCMYSAAIRIGGVGVMAGTSPAEAIRAAPLRLQHRLRHQRRLRLLHRPRHHFAC